MNAFKPICTHVEVQFPNLGNRHIKIMYEDLGIHCVFCGFIGHMEKHCKNFKKFGFGFHPQKFAWKNTRHDKNCFPIREANLETTFGMQNREVREAEGLSRRINRLKEIYQAKLQQEKAFEKQGDSNEEQFEDQDETVPVEDATYLNDPAMQDTDIAQGQALNVNAQVTLTDSQNETRYVLSEPRHHSQIPVSNMSKKARIIRQYLEDAVLHTGEAYANMDDPQRSANNSEGRSQVLKIANEEGTSKMMTSSVVGLEHPASCILGCEKSMNLNKLQIYNRTETDSICKKNQQMISESVSDRRSQGSRKRKSMEVEQLQSPMELITMPLTSDFQIRQADSEQEASSKKDTDGDKPQPMKGGSDYDKLLARFAYSVKQFGFDEGTAADMGENRVNLDQGWSSLIDITKPYMAGINPRSISAPNMHCYNPRSDSPCSPTVGENNPKSC